MGVVTDALQPILDGADTSTADIERMLDIDEAEGVWLDYIGVRLGIRRPATTDPAQDERFGFDDAGQPFDQALFRGFAENDAVYPLPDVVWRRFVKARVVTVLGDGTFQTFRKALLLVDPHALATDNRDMTVTIQTGLRELVDLADGLGVLPRTAGLMLVYV